MVDVNRSEFLMAIYVSIHQRLTDDCSSVRLEPEDWGAYLNDVDSVEYGPTQNTENETVAVSF